MNREMRPRPVEPPFGQLERALIEEFMRARGYDPHAVGALPEHERATLLAQASVYASGKLVEVEARSHFLDEIHNRIPATSTGGVS